MENAVLQRIRRVIDYSGLSDKRFAEVIDIPQTTLSSLFQRGNDPNISIVRDIIYHYPNISMPWMLFGNGNMLITQRGELLRKAREKRGLSPNEVAKALGVNIYFYGRLERGEIHLGDEYRNILNEKYGINISEIPEDIYPDQLIGGCENKPLILPSSEFIEYPIDNKQNAAAETRPRIPYAASAGYLTSSVEGVTEMQCEQIPLIAAFPTYDFTMLIKGDSMYPNYEGGDEVACKRIDSTSFIQWGKVHVLDTAQGIVIKRVYEDGGDIKCVSYNKEYPDFTIQKEEVYSMSLVVGLLRL